MKTNCLTRASLLGRRLWLLFLWAGSVSAEQFGLFTYVVAGDTVTITDYPRDAVGDVEIPTEIDGKAVTSIGDAAFWRCSDVTSITIPNRVTTIGDEAFFNCNSATTINIPEGVTTIGIGAFVECWSLTSITIPNSVTTIGDRAFDECLSVTRLTIPNRVTTIGSQVFRKCVRLPSVVIPNSVTKIGESAFEGCSSLTEITIPGSVTAIGGAAFRGCSSLANVSIPESVTSIDFEAFSSCSSLTEITIPGSVTTMGGGAFFRCSSLTRITIPTSVSTISSYAFFECIRLPSIIIPNSVSWIRDSAFGDCRSLTSLIIPDSVEWIDAGAFEGCSSLTEAIFLGNAPQHHPSFGGPNFDDTAHDFTVYHLSSSAGFTSPRWMGYPTVMIDESVYPAASWLLQHELPYDTMIHANGNLLIPYAFNLAPNKTPLINTVIDPVRRTLSLTFHASSPGITYAVMTSTDLRSWSAENVTLSTLAPNNTLTASVPWDEPNQFMRVVVKAKD